MKSRLEDTTTFDVTPTTGEPWRDTRTSFFLATLATVLDIDREVSNLGVIRGVSPLLGGAVVVAGVVSPFLALLELLVLQLGLNHVCVILSHRRDTITSV